jgi:hypothetical protein
VEAVALDALLAEARGDGVGEGLGRHGGVEGGVEAGEAGRLRIEFGRGVDERERGRDVERRVVDGGAERVKNLRGDAAVLAQMRAAVDDAVADGLGPHAHVNAAELLKLLRGVLEGARLRIMRGVFVVDGFACAVGDGERTARFADGVGGAAVEELRFFRRIGVVCAVEAELEGGGAAVDGEDWPSGHTRLRRISWGSLPLVAHAL